MFEVLIHNGGIQMGNDFLGQILGSVLGGARSGQSSPMGGGLGDLLGGMLGGGNRQPDSGLGGLGGLGGAGGMGGLGGIGGGSGMGMGSKGGALMVMLLPLAMQWVQRNGGIGAVLQRFQNKGYSQQAASWVSTGENEALEPQAMSEVMGTEELSRLSQQLGVSKEEVSSGMAQIMPQMVNHLTPEGGVPDDGDDVLDRGKSMLEQLMNPGRQR
ncbi:MAG: hypothetical protein JWR74_451 [Polaromonas sp.]|jgi:uncharacterized protein YidB (DUF937 family)|nr:hypothetical protein [Polaromonas sp.]